MDTLGGNIKFNNKQHQKWFDESLELLRSDREAFMDAYYTVINKKKDNLHVYKGGKHKGCYYSYTQEALMHHEELEKKAESDFGGVF